jgi:zinc protease
VQAEEVKAHLSDLLTGWEFPPPLQESAVPPVPRPAQIQRADRQIPGKSQVSLVWGVPGVARADPDYYAVLIANIILGQLGLMGRLGASVRDAQGLAYTVRSSIEAGPAAGPWSVRAGIAPQNVERAIEGIVQEIGSFLEKGPTPQEQADAATYLIGQLPLRLETNDGVAATLLSIERFVLGLDFVDRYPDIVGRITQEQVIAAIRRYLSTSEYALALAGPLE